LEEGDRDDFALPEKTDRKKGEKADGNVSASEKNTRKGH
jgi:hypothetical protein